MQLQPSHLWFKFVHAHYLVYNMSWEDIDVDLKLLDIQQDSNILTITSAGCNVLGYLLKSPSSITTVDINPKQTALLELKLRLIEIGEYSAFHDFFWYGFSEDYLESYERVKHRLTNPSRVFWDKHIRYFNPASKGLFFQGGSGYFARILNRIIDSKELREDVINLSFEDDRDRREIIFKQIENQIFGSITPNVWNNSAVLSLAGIPSSQRKAIGDLSLFLREVLHNVFVHQKAAENPYWGRYLNLSFEIPMKLEYLKEKNFETLRTKTDLIDYRSTSLRNYLANTTKSFSHFILLDHMDWLVEHKQEELISEWKYIINCAESKAKVLFRTAFHDLSFLPDFVFDYFEIEKIDDNWIAKNDRVGTYTGTFLGQLK